MRTRSYDNDLASYDGGEVWGWQGLHRRGARGAGADKRNAVNAPARERPR
jgi:hypothetical protein